MSRYGIGRRDPVTGRKTGGRPLNRKKLKPQDLDDYMMGEDDEDDEGENAETD